MNRKIRFLMLFVFAISSILGVYLISGCGDDTVVEAPIPEVRDTLTVVGSIQGVVKGAYDNQPINGATVQYIKDTTTQTVTTDAAGKYVINDSLSSGGYVLTFSFGGHASMRGNAYIPTLEELKGDQDNQQSGLIKFVDTLDMVMFETNSSVSGRIWAAPPLAQKNGNLDPFAADTNASLQAGVTVMLDWGTLFKDMGGDTVAGSYDIVPSAASTTTDDSGWYFFTNVPAVTSGYVKLMTGPFSRADSLFGDTTMFIKLLRGQNRSVPDLFVPVLCTSAPGIVRKNFDNVSRFNYFDSLVIVFSQPIDTTGARFMATLVGQNSGVATFTTTWSAGLTTVTLNPALALTTDEAYTVTLSGQSQGGCPISSGPFTFTVEDGISMVSSNAERAPELWDNFDINSDVTILFNMTPVIDPLQGIISLQDMSSAGGPFQVDITNSVSGNSLVINPDNPLEKSHTYRADWKVFSSIPGDFHMYSLTFMTEVDSTVPPAVTGFALNMPQGWRADYDTTQVTFRWNTLPSATGYRVFAKDNHANTDFVQIADFAPQDFLQFQVGTVTLPTQFDLFNDDGIQTPFSDSTTVTFDIRAYNGLNTEGPFSGSAITVKDETPPLGVSITHLSGSFDNVTNTNSRRTYWQLDNPIEYVETNSGVTPVFAFTEAGGDETYVLSSGAANWYWANGFRDDDSITIDVPAAMGAAGDSMMVTIKDNSGNDTTIAFRLTPYLDYSFPTSGSADFEASLDTPVTFSYTGYPGESTQPRWNYWLSFDSGATWMDSAYVVDQGTGSYNPTVYDTVMSATARIGLIDTLGGIMWWTDFFSYNGIMMTSPDSATYFTMDSIWDAGGTDSTGVPMAWNYVGINDVYIYYYNDWDDEWNLHDSVMNQSGTYTFYPPDIGRDYKAEVEVRDLDADERPRDDNGGWRFQVLNDWVNITQPVSATVVPGGASYDVQWNMAGDPAQVVQVEWKLHTADTVWLAIDTSKNDGSRLWAAPDTIPTTDAWVRILTSDGAVVLDSAGPFTLGGMTITAPVSGNEWAVGSAQTITWTTVDPGGVGNVDLYWSTTNFTDSTLIAANQPNGANGSYSWTVDAAPSTNAKIRIWGVGQAVQATSDAFTVCGITVTAPNGGENWAVGSNATITWGSIGTCIDSVEIHYTTDGSVWKQIVATTPDDGSFAWTVANDPADGTVKVRIRKAGSSTGSDVSDASFTISGVIVTAPNGAEDWAIGTTQNVTWSKVSTVGNVKIDYTLDGGTNWHPVPGASSVVSSLQAFAWDMNLLTQPDANLDTVTLNAFVRITEVSGTIADQSNAAFTVSNAAPILTPIGAKAGSENALLTFTTTGTDADGINAQMTATNMPTGATFTDNGDGTGTFSWTPSFTQGDTDPTVYNVTFATSDGLWSDNEVVVISIANTNQAPILSAIGAKSVANNNLLTINTTAADADTDPITYTVIEEGQADLSGLPNGGTPAAFVDNGDGTGTFTWTPNATGTYQVRFTVADGNGGSDFEIVTITVN